LQIPLGTKRKETEEGKKKKEEKSKKHSLKILPNFFGNRVARKFGENKRERRGKGSLSSSYLRHPPTAAFWKKLGENGGRGEEGDGLSP